MPPELASRWRIEGRWADRTLAEEMRCAAAQHADSPVVYHGGAGQLVTTVGSLHARALWVAASLARLGVRPGDAVGIQVPNWPEGTVAHAAGWLAGAVLVPIVPIYGPAEVSFTAAVAAAITGANSSSENADTPASSARFAH